MTRFIETDRGWINLAHVERITRSLKEGAETAALYDPSGEVIGRYRGYLDVEILNAHIVSAAAGQTAIRVYVWADDRPTMADVHVEHLPVVAWRIYPEGDPEPVLCEAAVSNATDLVAMQDGKLLHIGNTHYCELAEAKQAILANAQYVWDRRNPAAPATAEAKAEVVR